MCFGIAIKADNFRKVDSLTCIGRFLGELYEVYVNC
jgi:hypothetical protein